MIDVSDGEESNEIQSRAIKKLCFIADPRYESLSVRIGVSPDTIGRCRRELGLLPRNCIIQEAVNLLSFAVGAVVGRWDVRIVNSQTEPPVLGVFDASPQCPPAMLQNETGAPASATPEGYPFRINWDGIIVDDEEHEDDILHRVRETLEVIWGDQADGIKGNLQYTRRQRTARLFPQARKGRLLG